MQPHLEFFTAHVNSHQSLMGNFIIFNITTTFDMSVHKLFLIGEKFRSFSKHVNNSKPKDIRSLERIKAYPC